MINQHSHVSDHEPELPDVLDGQAEHHVHHHDGEDDDENDKDDLVEPGVVGGDDGVIGLELARDHGQHLHERVIQRGEGGVPGEKDVERDSEGEELG